MRRFRLLTAAAVVALMGATIGGSAHADTPGVGTASSAATILGLNLSHAFGAEVLTDISKSSIDPSVGTPEAFTVLSPLGTRSVIPELNVSVPSVESRSRGESNAVESETMAFPADIAAALSGTVTPAKFQSVVDAAGARSSLVTQLLDVAIGAGLIGVDAVDSTLSTNASPTNAVSERSASIDSVTVLDVGGLLDLLGVNIGDVSVDSLLAMVDQLGVTLPGVGDADDVVGQITGLLAAIDQLDDLKDSLNGATVSSAAVDLSPVTDVLDDVEDTADTDGGISDLTDEVKDTLAAHGVDVPDVTNLADVESALDEVLGLLEGALSETVTAVDAISLLELNDVTVAITAIAGKTVGESSAKVEATIGSISAVGQELAGVDLLSTLDQLQAQADAVTSQINGVLATVDPGLGLADLIDVSLLDRGTDVSQSNGYVRSLASLTAATVSINPPVNLDELLATLGGADSVATTIEGLGGDLPDLGLPGTPDGAPDAPAGVPELPADPADLLSSALGIGTGEAGGPSGGQVQVLRFSNTADFAAAGSGGPGGTGGELPRTGGTATPALLIGTVALAAAAGTRRWLRSTAS